MKKSLLAKILCMMLAMCMLLAVMASCATEEDDATAASTDATGDEVLGTETEEFDDGLSDLDFNTEVKIVVSESQAYQVFAAEETDNVIYNAIYKRGMTVEERLGVEITWVSMDAAWNNNRDVFFQHIQSTCETGSAYDAVCLYNLMPGALAAKGLMEKSGRYHLHQSGGSLVARGFHQ